MREIKINDPLVSGPEYLDHTTWQRPLETKYYNLMQMELDIKALGFDEWCKVVFPEEIMNIRPPEIRNKNPKEYNIFCKVFVDEEPCLALTNEEESMVDVLDYKLKKYQAFPLTANDLVKFRELINSVVEGRFPDDEFTFKI